MNSTGAIASSQVSAPDSDELAAIEYQRARLRLGIAGVGSGVLVSAGLMFLVLGGWAVALGGGLATSVAIAAGVGAGMAVLQLAFDAAGLKLDARHRLHTCSASTSSCRLIGESARWLAGFVSASTIVATLFTLLPTAWPAVLIALAGFGVLLRWALPGRPAGTVVVVDDTWRRELDTAIANAGLPARSIVVIDVGETTLAGGLIGSDRVWVTRAVSETSPAIAATLVAREIAHATMHHRAKNALVSFVSLAAGVLIAFVIVGFAGEPIASHAGSVVLTLISTMTLMAFASLFVFPAIGRHQVLEVDRFVARRFGIVAAHEMLQTLAHKNLANRTLSQAKAYVFHPIPTMAVRHILIDQKGDR